MGKTYEYSNGDITVLWKPDLCIHSAICVKGLSNVFQPNERPWIKVEASTSEKIASQVRNCPSGALGLKSEDNPNPSEESLDNVKVSVIENGPLIISGKLEIYKPDGSHEIKEDKTSFCRCGFSSNKPYCDGSHNSSGFIG